MKIKDIKYNGLNKRVNYERPGTTRFIRDCLQKLSSSFLNFRDLSHVDDLRKVFAFKLIDAEREVTWDNLDKDPYTLEELSKESRHKQVSILVFPSTLTTFERNLLKKPNNTSVQESFNQYAKRIRTFTLDELDFVQIETEIIDLFMEILEPIDNKPEDYKVYIQGESIPEERFCPVRLLEPISRRRVSRTKDGFIVSKAFALSEKAIVSEFNSIDLDLLQDRIYVEDITDLEYENLYNLLMKRGLAQLTTLARLR